MQGTTSKPIDSSASPRIRKAIWAIIAVSLAVHILALVAGNTVFAGWKGVHYPLHACAEFGGSVISILVAMMLVSLERRNEGTSFNIPIACALVAMGILDGLHAAVHAGKIFVWLHSAATLFGGLLFCLVCLPKKRLAKLNTRWIWGVTLFSLGFGLLSIANPSAIPKMTMDGGFTTAAKSMNIFGGLFFLVAGVTLVRVYFRDRFVDDLMFSLHCILFGAASIMFEQSTLWDLPWWGWHVLRLMAYAVAFWFVVLTVMRSAQIQRVSRALSDSEQRLEAVLGTVVDGIVTISEEGTIELFNSAAEKILGYRAEDVIGKNVNILMEGSHATQHDEYLRRYLKTGEKHIIGARRELHARRSDGATIPIELGVSEVELAEGRVFTGVIRDISERVAMYAELQNRALELESANSDLERFNQLALSREERIIELKLRLNEMLENTNRPPEFQGNYDDVETQFKQGSVGG